MSTIITREALMAERNNMAMDGLVLVRSYTEKASSSGASTFMTGTLEGKGSFPFKAWQDKEAFAYLKENDCTNMIFKVEANVNDFGGTKSLIISKMEPYTGTDVSQLDFLLQKYDEQQLWDSMMKVLNDRCSAEAMVVFHTVMLPIEARFRKEFAAINHHDNCLNGLLAHTSKVVKIAQVLQWYPTICDAATVDALYIGAALHDIGKILEYNNGAISEQGQILNHLTLGLGLVTMHKDEIVRQKGVHFYNTLLSVVQQHHGEYGERPKTVAAYLVHLIDNLEATLTSLQESIETSTTDMVKQGDFYLRFMKK